MPRASRNKKPRIHQPMGYNAGSWPNILVSTRKFNIFYLLLFLLILFKERPCSEAYLFFFGFFKHYFYLFVYIKIV